jgi:hypothetical protein
MNVIARWREWRRARGSRLCHRGIHRWSSIADRIYCKRCQVWYPG